MIVNIGAGVIVRLEVDTPYDQGSKNIDLVLYNIAIISVLTIKHPNGTNLCQIRVYHYRHDILVRRHDLHESNPISIQTYKQTRDP